MFKKKALSLALTALVVAGSSLIGASGATASPQVYDPCQRLSAGQTKYASYGANRVTFATAETRSSNVVTITSCVRSGNGYAQEWQDWGYAGLNGFAPPGLTWEDTFKSPTGSYSVTEALGRSNPGTALNYHTVKWNSKWGGEYGTTYNQYFEGAGGESDENLYTYMNQGYYEQAAVINYNRQPDMNTVQGASYAIFLHAGRTTSAGCISTSLETVTRFLRSSSPGDRIIMGAVDDVFTPYTSNTFGSISRVYGYVGGPASSLGSPTSNEIGGLKNNGAYQMFQGGAIVWSPETGAFISTGAIRTTWGSQGFENGYLGYPIADEVRSKDGGAYQKYQGGTIYWSNYSGARITTGSINYVYSLMGAENSQLGYPTTNEIGGLKDGGVYQMFQGGAIVWSPKSGAHVSTGGIRNVWAANGFENGRLGYPTSDEYSSNGEVIQNYQGGKIAWSPWLGARVIS